MVVINVKRLPREEHSKDYDEFLYEVPNTASVAEVTETVTEIQNLRVRVKWTIAAAKGLLKDDVEEGQKHILMGPLSEAERYMALERCIEGKKTSSVSELKELCQLFKGAVMILFPQDVTGPDYLRRLTAMLEAESSDEKIRAHAHRLLSIVDDGAATEDILRGSTIMWWSGKPLQKDAQLLKYTGKNDKTKLIVKLTVDSGSAPPREPGLDARTQTEMMAYWYKKQEEAKKMVEDDDIAYGNSEWADSQGLKKQFLGMADVKFRAR